MLRNFWLARRWQISLWASKKILGWFDYQPKNQMEMKHKSVDDLRWISRDYTGIADIWDNLGYGIVYQQNRIYHYVRRWYIKGYYYKERNWYGDIYYYGIDGFRVASFEDMFESLPEEYQEVILWNLDQWK